MLTTSLRYTARSPTRVLVPSRTFRKALILDWNSNVLGVVRWKCPPLIAQMSCAQARRARAARSVNRCVPRETEVRLEAACNRQITRLWSWLLPPFKWSFNARAETDSKVLEFDGEAVLKDCESDPAFGYEVIKRFSALMAERLDAAHRKMMEQWSPAGFA